MIQKVKVWKKNARRSCFVIIFCFSLATVLGIVVSFIKRLKREQKKYTALSRRRFFSAVVSKTFDYLNAAPPWSDACWTPLLNICHDLVRIMKLQKEWAKPSTPTFTCERNLTWTFSMSSCLSQTFSLQRQKELMRKECKMAKAIVSFLSN